MESDILIKTVDLSRHYKVGEEEVIALDKVNLEIERNKICAILGTSGSGKSTLLNMLAGIERPSGGEVYIGKYRIDNLSEADLAKFRQKFTGFIFQSYNLMPTMTALENVELAMQICKYPLDAKKVLEEVGLKERMNNFPAQLSGGEQQRVAIARALAKNPKLLLCDEPTGALDYVTGKAILKLLQDTCREKEMTVIVITHNSALAPMADRVIKIRNGKVAETVLNEKPMPVEEIEW